MQHQLGVSCWNNWKIILPFERCSLQYSQISGFNWSEVPVHSGQHCPGLVTGWTQGACGQTSGRQVTVPLTQVQRWQGLEEDVKVWLWPWTTPSYRQESQTGQQESEGTGWEHWTGHGLFWQFTTSFWSDRRGTRRVVIQPLMGIWMNFHSLKRVRLTRQEHCEQGSEGEVKEVPDWYSLPKWRQIPVQRGQHSPGGVTGCTQVTLGQDTCVHTTPPF